MYIHGTPSVHGRCTQGCTVGVLPRARVHVSFGECGNRRFIFCFRALLASARAHMSFRRVREQLFTAVSVLFLEGARAHAHPATECTFRAEREKCKDRIGYGAARAHAGRARKQTVNRLFPHSPKRHENPGSLPKKSAETALKRSFRTLLKDT